MDEPMGNGLTEDFAHIPEQIVIDDNRNDQEEIKSMKSEDQADKDYGMFTNTHLQPVKVHSEKSEVQTDESLEHVNSHDSFHEQQLTGIEPEEVKTEEEIQL